MSISLLLPLGLIALFGLIAPLLIHLVRQPDNRLIDFPALRWLRESARPRRRLRFEDPWLLLARLLLVGLAALLVSLPILNGSLSGARRVIAVVPGVDIDAARQKIGEAPAEWHWLAAGFPEIDKPLPSDGSSMSSLLRELDAELPDKDALSVIVTDPMRGLDAERIRISRPIEWIILPAQPPGEVPERSVEYVLALRHQSANDEGLGYIRAAVASWDPAGSPRWTTDDKPSTEALPAQTDAVIWLGSPVPDSIRAWVRDGGRALMIDDASASDSDSDSDSALWRDDRGTVLAHDEILGSGHLIHLHGPLNAAALPNLLDADFPLRLQALLRPVPPPLSQAGAAEVQPRRSLGNLPRFAPSIDLIPWIGLLIGFVFLIERGLATRRREA